MTTISAVKFSIVDISDDLNKQFKVKCAVCHEGISRQPSCQITLISDAKVEIDLSTWLGRTAVMDVSYSLDKSDPQWRRYAGIIFSANKAIVKSGDPHALILELRAWPSAGNRKHFLKGYRTFNGKSTDQIVKDIFQVDAGGTLTPNGSQSGENLSSSFQYQTQYAESDYDFVARLIGENRQIFLIDYAKSSVQEDHPNPKCKLNIFSKLNECQDSQLSLVLGSAEVDSNPMAVWDIRYTMDRGPNTIAVMSSSQSSEELCAYQASTENATWIEMITEQRYEKTQYGETIGADLIDARKSSRYTFQCNHPMLMAGHKINIDQQSLVVTSLVQTIEMIDQQSVNANNMSWIIKGCVKEAVDPAHAYLPPAMPKPRIDGILRGIVLDDAASPTTIGHTDDKTVHTDQYGRIKVRILWQTYENNETKTDNDFAWLRLMSPWVGSKAGFYGLPRAGQEVIVSFINGDPAQPIVLGCVYGQEENILPKAWQPGTLQTINNVGIATHQPESSGKPGQHLWLDSNRNNTENKGVSLQSIANIDIQAETDIRLSVFAKSPAGSSYIQVLSTGKVEINAPTQLAQASSSSTSTSNTSDWKEYGSQKTRFGKEAKFGGTSLETIGAKGSIVGESLAMTAMKNDFTGISTTLVGEKLEWGGQSYKCFGTELKVTEFKSTIIGSSINAVGTSVANGLVKMANFDIFINM